MNNNLFISRGTFFTLIVISALMAIAICIIGLLLGASSAVDPSMLRQGIIPL